jgi:hypothetical protein
MPTNPALLTLLRDLPGEVRSAAQAGSARLEKRCHPTGLAELDACLGGGLPVGRASELCGSLSSGATSLILRLVAGITRDARLVAWVEWTDAFDPADCGRAGAALERLLWVRAPDEGAAFESTEVLLHGGGFSLVVLDLRSARRYNDNAGRHRPASVWVRLSRAAAKTRSTLIVLSGATPALCGIPAAVRLMLQPGRPRWSVSATRLLEGLDVSIHIHRASAGFGRVFTARFP